MQCLLVSFPKVHLLFKIYELKFETSQKVIFLVFVLVLMNFLRLFHGHVSYFKIMEKRHFEI